MTGTAQQIQWAEQIKAKYEADAATELPRLKERGEARGGGALRRYESAVKAHEAILAHATCAGWWIGFRASSPTEVRNLVASCLESCAGDADRAVRLAGNP